MRPHSHWRIARLFLCLSLLLAPPVSEAEQRRVSPPRTLDQRIEAILAQNDAKRGFWGIVVVRCSDGRRLYARNADHLFHPASNMKLFTTAAAIEQLGPGLVFRTTVETDSAPDAQGRVGDLILVGRGDPNLSNRVLPYQLKAERQGRADVVLQKLADQVAANGVREVTGNLVADDSYFLFEPYGHDWTHEDLQWGYGAPVTALAFHDNALILRILPAATVGATAQVWLEPISDYYQINNRVQTTSAGTRKRVFVERAPGSNLLDIWGSVPLGAKEHEDTVSLEDPPRLIAELFRRALEERGVTLRGRVEVRRVARIAAATGPDSLPKVPPRLTLAEHVSVPLQEGIKVINKVSQNLHAEMLLRTLGRDLKNLGSLTAGLEVLQEFAAQVGIRPGETVFADGSGLSRRALLTPRAVVKLLEYMARSPHFETFRDSLPVAGLDGTLAERFQNTPARGRVLAKTGTIEHVNALSGYMELRSGKRLAFSIIGNSHPLEAAAGAAALDRIALVIFRWFSAQERSVGKAPRPR